MTEREALKLALEALETGLCYVENEDFDNKQKFRGYEHLMPTDAAESIQEIKTAITAIKEALAQPEQKPMAWESVLGAVARGWCYEENANKTMDSELAVAIAKEVHALYTTPPQRTWVGLNWDDLPEIYVGDTAFLHGAKWAEAKLKEKNETH